MVFTSTANNYIGEYFSDGNSSLFSLESLSSKGNLLKSKDKEIRISLLTDDDIIYLLKNVCISDIGGEYFARNKRMNPIWKSEAEYRAYICGSQGKIGPLEELIERDMISLIKFINKAGTNGIVNSRALEYCEEEILKVKNSQTLKGEAEKHLHTVEKYLRWIQLFQEIAKDYNIPFEFLMLDAKQFSSGFGNLDFGKLQIEFDSAKKKICEFRNVCNTLHNSEKVTENFFYIFYRRNEENRISIKDMFKRFRALENDLD